MQKTNKCRNCIDKHNLKVENFKLQKLIEIQFEFENKYIYLRCRFDYQFSMDKFL